MTSEAATHDPWVTRALAVITWWIDRRRSDRRVTSADRDRLRWLAFARLTDVRRSATPEPDRDLQASLAAESVLMEHAPADPPPSTTGGLASTSDGLSAHGDTARIRSLAASLEQRLSKASFRLFWAMYVERLDPEDVARRLRCAPRDLDAAHRTLLDEVRAVAAEVTP